jgi:hypothetical protein
MKPEPMQSPVAYVDEHSIAHAYPERVEGRIVHRSLDEVIRRTENTARFFCSIRMSVRLLGAKGSDEALCPKVPESRLTIVALDISSGSKPAVLHFRCISQLTFWSRHCSHGFNSKYEDIII